jgi:Flp pilus assembly protein TadB
MEVLTNPLIIPLGAFLVAIVAIAGGLMGQAHSRRLKAEQRMAMVARGMSTEEIEKLLGNSEQDDRPSKSPKDPLRSLGNARRAGIVLVSTGMGLVIFFVALAIIVDHHQVLAGAAAGLIPLAIGIGFFIDYNLQKRELSRFGLEVGAELPADSRAR